MSKRIDTNVNGKHAIIEAYGPISQLTADALIVLLMDSAAAAGAKVLAKHIHEFGEQQGNTGVVLLAESHISVHTWPELNYAALDIFMCGRTQLEEALKVLKQANGNHAFKVKILNRGKKLSEPTPKQLADSIMTHCPAVANTLENTPCGCTTDSHIAVTELSKFLILCAKSASQLSAPGKILKMWQTFLLYTAEYERFCSEHFDAFIHHDPQHNSRAENLQFTLFLYQQLFGQHPNEFWQDDTSTAPSLNKKKVTLTL